MKTLEKIMSSWGWSIMIGMLGAFVLNTVLGLHGWAVMLGVVVVVGLNMAAYTLVVALNLLRDDPSIGPINQLFWDLLRSAFSRPAVVYAENGLIGHRVFWRMKTAEEWASLHRPLYDFISIPMPTALVPEFEEWLNELLWPHRGE